MVGSSDTKVTTANGYRLPTEAEWEYIARGGNCGIPESQTKYAGSDNVDDVAWYSGNANSKTHEVKGKEPISDEIEIYDMSGNVYELCFDWYDDSNLSGSTPITGSASGNNRVLRGGSWYFDASYCAVSYRSSNNPNGRINFIGFRLVRSSSN